MRFIALKISSTQQNIIAEQKPINQIMREQLLTFRSHLSRTLKMIEQSTSDSVSSETDFLRVKAHHMRPSHDRSLNNPILSRSQVSKNSGPESDFF